MNTENNSGTDTPAAASTFTDTAALDALRIEAEQPEGQRPGAATVAARDPAEYMSEAGMLIGMGLQILAVKLGVVLDQQTKDEGAKKLAAVLAKHNGVMPDWYKRYEEEFALGIWCAGVAWKSYEMYQQRNAAKPAPAGGGGGDAQAG